MIMFLVDKLKKFRVKLNNDAPMSRHIPYTHHYDEHTLHSNGGRLVQFIRISGLNTSTMSEDDIVDCKDLLGALIFSSMSPDISFYTHVIRRKRSAFPENGYIKNSYAERLNLAWSEKQSDVRVNEIYLTVVLKPSAGFIDGIGHLFEKISFRANKEAKREYLEARCRKLDDVTRVLISRLTKYDAAQLKVINLSDTEILCSEPISFLHYLINASYVPIRLPRMSISVFLAQFRSFVHRETLVFRGLTADKFGAVLSVKEYSDRTEPAIVAVVAGTAGLRQPDLRR